MEVMQAILGRRSVRKYKPDPVKDEVLESLLEAARWAPSWANTQCWRLVVVRDSEIKGRLAGTLKSVSPGRENRASLAIKNAPVVIVACAELKCSGYYKEQAATDKGDWYMFDLALAMQNLMLAAHAAGLGTVHIGLFDAVEAGKIVGVPNNVVVVEMTPLGYPDEQPVAPRRKELSELVFFNKYGSQKLVGGR